jgi:hypothetical protein
MTSVLAAVPAHADVKAMAASAQPPRARNADHAKRY